MPGRTDKGDTTAMICYLAATGYDVFGDFNGIYACTDGQFHDYDFGFGMWVW